jgi:hypothetical protein
MKRIERKKKKHEKQNDISRKHGNSTSEPEKIYDWAEEARLLKKLKAHKMTEEEFEQAMEGDFQNNTMSVIN